MTAIPEIVTGDDNTLAVTLKKNGVTFAIDAAADVQAALVSTGHTEVYAEAVTQSNATPGADWPHSLVVIEIPSLSTAEITYQGLAKLEIQVIDGSVTKTWFLVVRIVRGNI